MKPHAKFFFYCGAAMLLSEIWKQWCLTYQLNNGQYNWWHFPFQLCSLPMYVCLLLPFVREPLRRVLLTFLMDFGLLAGFFTFLDTSGLFHGYAPLTVHSFVWHFLLIVLGICAGYGGRADYSTAGCGKSAAIYLGGCALATIFNLLFRPYGPINLFYISPYYRMTQRVFGEIADSLGNTAGISAYIFSILLGAGISHHLWKYVMLYRTKRGGARTWPSKR